MVIQICLPGADLILARSLSDNFPTSHRGNREFSEASCVTASTWRRKPVQMSGRLSEDIYLLLDFQTGFWTQKHVSIDIRLNC